MVQSVSLEIQTTPSVELQEVLSVNFQNENNYHEFLVYIFNKLNYFKQLNQSNLVKKLKIVLK
jgi:hypothetical protein